jgi:hypothetical protein
MQARGQAPLVLKLAPYAETHASELSPVESMPRIVWIGGSEPLEYPEIPRYANDVAASAREVFLHTGGALLRRRAHEFQPTARFRFVLQFDGASTADNRMAREAIRGAQLSGFLTCALSVLGEHNDLDPLEKLHADLHQLDLDGYLIVSAANTPESNRALSAARHRLLNRRWRRLSSMFDSVASTAEVASQSPRGIARTRTAVMPRIHPEHTSRDCGEGAQA